jgi:hypothetical protein
MSYIKISEFGSGAAYAPVNNPLSYGLSGGMDNMFMHGGAARAMQGGATREFAAYAAEYCSTNFDGFCAAMTDNSEIEYFPDLLHGAYEGGVPTTMTKGDVVLLNTARTKYLMRMIGGNVSKVPFDPLVAASPLVTVYTAVPGDFMRGEYFIPKGHDVDNDLVMQRLLNKPLVSLPLLLNIYDTMKKMGRLEELAGTKLGLFYDNLKKNAPKFNVSMAALSAGMKL